PRTRGKPRLAIPICSAPDIPTARPAVRFRVPLREAKRKINAYYQPAGPAAQADQFIAELRPRPAVLKEAEHAVLDHSHPRRPAPVVGAARPIDGDQHESRHGGIVNPAPPNASTEPPAPRGLTVRSNQRVWSPRGDTPRLARV